MKPLSGVSLTELARRLGISVSGVEYSVEKGEIIAISVPFKPKTGSLQCIFFLTCTYDIAIL